MFKRIILLLCSVFIVSIIIQRDLYAVPLMPAKIGGTVTVDGTQIIQTDIGYTFTVTKQDGTPYNPAAEDMDGLNASDLYVIDIPIYDATEQPGGARPGEAAVIHVYLKGEEIDVILPANGQITVDDFGSINQIDITAVTNYPPSIPKLVYPADKDQALGTSLTFRWEKCSDQDGDPITYTLYYSEDITFTVSNSIQIAAMNSPKTFFAWNSIGLSFFGIALMGGIKGRKKLLALLIMMAAITVLLVSCGSGGGGGGGEKEPPPPINTMTIDVSDLNPGATYYWKVVADDGNGGITESDIQSFETL